MTKTFFPSFHALGRGALLATGCCAALIAAPASAQTGSDPIVVAGEHVTAAVARDRAAAFVRATGVASSETRRRAGPIRSAHGCSASSRTALGRRSG